MSTENPKEQAGRMKPPMHLLSPSAMQATACALGHGAAKYQPRNYRMAGINATTYVGAILRHAAAWNDGEDLDPESGLSHVAHVAACCDIILDSLSCGMMNDDRSKKPTPAEARARMANSVLREVTPGKPIPVPNPAYQDVPFEEIRGTFEQGKFRTHLVTSQDHV